MNAMDQLRALPLSMQGAASLQEAAAWRLPSYAGSLTGPGSSHPVCARDFVSGEDLRDPRLFAGLQKAGAATP